MRIRDPRPDMGSRTTSARQVVDIQRGVGGVLELRDTYYRITKTITVDTEEQVDFYHAKTPLLGAIR